MEIQIKTNVGLPEIPAHVHMPSGTPYSMTGTRYT